ncbi:hypothetical protein B4102_2153 [Heyndrickxia sporothermodurans]|uniref:Integrase n=1 Tax=Heyndrickxia sporothermodurans TaxID=46224 RepID=A0A150LGQ3_9BACI|nr:site-specific integrase [Heyndrickxia sporothermodurans]KYD11425.1 hypothetical protein B4102_2153 [Heyndrickxia sporothermodurans]
MTHFPPNYTDSYFNFLVSKGIKTSTLKQYSSDLNKFFFWMNNYKGTIEFNTFMALNDRDFEIFIGYISEKGYSDATFRRILSVLNQFLKHFNINSDVLLAKPKERPLRSLNKNDFISDDEMDILLKSMSKLGTSEARNYLIERNLAIVCLVRYYGLTPNDIASITMNGVNLAQKTIAINSNGTSLKIKLQDEHIQYIRTYRRSIDKSIRPRFRSKDPLFVAFFNLTFSFRFDYAAGIPQPLSVRAIQEMIKDEVKFAGLRKISAKHLRNSCILNFLSYGYSINKVITYFRLSDPFSINRYQKYLKSIES